MFLAISMFCSLVAAQQGATTSSSATVPRLVNFSGKTTDPQGKAISGIAGVTFAIYKDQYEGASLWLETQNVQADAKGNYTVQLGATKPDGLPGRLSRTRISNTYAAVSCPVTILFSMASRKPESSSNDNPA